MRSFPVIRPTINAKHRDMAWNGPVYMEASFPASRIPRQGWLIICQCLHVAGKLGQEGENLGKKMKYFVFGAIQRFELKGLASGRFQHFHESETDLNDKFIFKPAVISSARNFGSSFALRKKRDGILLTRFF